MDLLVADKGEIFNTTLGAKKSEKEKIGKTSFATKWFSCGIYKLMVAATTDSIGLLIGASGTRMYKQISLSYTCAQKK